MNKYRYLVKGMVKDLDTKEEYERGVIVVAQNATEAWEKLENTIKKSGYNFELLDIHLIEEII